MSEVIFSEIIHREIVESLIPNKDAYVNHALSLKDSIKLETDWHCNTYNTIATADLKNDPLFFDIIQQTGRRVIDFANEYSVNAVSATCVDGWINVAGHMHFQEFHQHPVSHFSAVYYIDVPENSGNIRFKSHEADTDMFPLPTPRQDLLIPARKTFCVEPKDGMLIIFRSNLQHMVHENKTNKNRITFAMNFIVDVEND
jgi:uncharacterized protein (TIGR02466 family)